MVGHITNICLYILHSSFLQREQVKQVACGAFHTLVVNNKGRMFAFGGGLYGKLGHGNTQNCTTPLVVDQTAADDDLSAYMQVACGTLRES